MHYLFPPLKKHSHKLLQLPPHFCTKFSTKIPLSSKSNSQEKPLQKNSSLHLLNQSNYSLLRSMLILKICSTDFIVRNSFTFYNFSRKILGPKVTHYCVKKTFFDHFIGGENEEEILKLSRKLYSDHKIYPILDYSFEMGDSTKMSTEEIQKSCVKSLKVFMSCVKIAAKIPKAMVAVKLTALVDPSLLKRMAIYVDLNQAIAKFYGQNLNKERVIDETKKYFNERWGNLCSNVTAEELQNLVEYLSERVSENLFPSMPVREYFINKKVGDEYWLKFTENEMVQIDELEDSLYKIGRHALDSKVSVMVDAEQSYLQPAIDFVTIRQMARLNFKNGDIPPIFNTVQTYLKNSVDRYKSFLLNSNQNNYKMAVKLVCGAYMVSEADLAKNCRYPNPIFDSKQETVNNYKKCIQLSLSWLNNNKNNNNSKNYQFAVETIVASHNEKICNFAEEMSGNLPFSHRNKIRFAQLYGMSDKTTFSLASRGRVAYKYIPFGKVEEVIPYLLRRMEENNSIVPRIRGEYEEIKVFLKQRVFRRRK